MNKNTISDEMLEKLLAADRINSETLVSIVSDNSNTEFGQRHGFAEIKTIDDYRKNVPLSDYSAYAESIERMRNGEKNVLTVYEPASYCHTSGSTGEPKYIPISNKALERYSDSIERYKNKFIRETGGKRLLISSFRTDPDKPLGSEVLLSEAYYRHLYLSGNMDITEYAGSRDMIFIGDEPDIMYAKLWTALAERNIVLIEALFLYEILNFFSYFKDNWKSILHDMRNKEIPETVKLSEKVRKYLLSLNISADRSNEIENECRKGFGRIAESLWNVKLISGIGNKSSLSEETALKLYTGSIRLYYYGYCASECFIGIPIGIGYCEYVLLPGNAFFEFLPDDSEETVLPHEAAVGKEYEIVLTNLSGLYRYRMGDVVKITGMTGKSPIMEFVGRKGQALNIAGEKYCISQLEKALYRMRPFGINTEYYYIGMSMGRIPGRYAAVMTCDAVGDMPDEQETAYMLDKALMEYNRDYADLRELKQIDRPFVFLCTESKFNAFMEESGIKPQSAHEKPRHIANKEVSETEWKRMLQRK